MKKSIDLDLSGDFDWAVQVWSADGSTVHAANPSGPANITAIGLPGTTTSIDGDGDGRWDVEVARSTWRGFRAIDEIAFVQRKDAVETRMDEDDDGTFESIHTEFRTGMSRTIPVWDAVTWNGTTFRKHEAWDFNETEWHYGYVDAQDGDGDGVFETETRSVDAITWDSVGGVFRTYESHEKTTRRWIVDKKNTTSTADDTRRLQVNITRSNDLAERVGFTLLGADGETPMLLDVIVQDDVPVLLDPRVALPYLARVDDHGCIYWADLDNDTIYETGFVLTSVTKHSKEAIGFFFDTDLDMVFDTDYADMARDDHDQFWPSAWLSDRGSFEAIRGIAWEEAFKDYKIERDSNWDKFFAMAVAQGVIMYMVSAALAASTTFQNMGPYMQAGASFAAVMIALLSFQIVVAAAEKETRRLFMEEKRAAGDLLREELKAGEVYTTTFQGGTVEYEGYTAFGKTRPNGWYKTDVTKDGATREITAYMGLPVLRANPIYPAGGLAARHRAHDWYMNTTLHATEQAFYDETEGKLARVMPVMDETGKVGFVCLPGSAWLPEWGNHSSPAYKIHYQVMVYASTYAIFYEEGMKKSLDIFFDRLWLNTLSAFISFGVSMGLQAAMPAWTKPAAPGELPRPLSWWDNFKLILTGSLTPTRAESAMGMLNWASQSLQESILEGFISTTLERYGGPFFGNPVIADQLAEVISFAFVDNIFEIGEAISSIPSAISRASIRFQINGDYQRAATAEAEMYWRQMHELHLASPMVIETITELHYARMALVEAKKSWSLDTLAATLAAGGSIRDFRAASQVWPQVVDRIESRMVNFPNVDKQQDRLLSTLVNQVLKTKLLAKAMLFHDVGLTFAQFAAMADVKAACYLNPGATIEVDAAYLDESGHVRIARWGKLKNMDIGTFLATHRGFQLVFRDPGGDPNTRTTLGTGNWWTHDPDLHLWVPKKLVAEFDRIYPDYRHDNKGNLVTRWVCPACGATHTDYYHARAHAGGYVVDTIDNKRLDPAQKARRVAELLEEGRGEVYYDKEWFATKLGVTEKNNPIIYDMIMHAEKLPASVFYAERKDIAARLKTDPEFRRQFGSSWLAGAYCEGQIVALYKSGTHAIPGGDAEWHFRVKGIKHFTTADGMAYKRTEVRDAQGQLVGWDYQAAIALEGKFRDFCDTNDFFKSFIHDLVATPRTTKLISGVALGILRDTNIANYFKQLLSKQGEIVHPYWRPKIVVNGERWNMAFIEEGKKGSGIGTHVQYRLIATPGSTVLGHPDYDVKDGISANYDVEYRISRPAMPESAVPDGQPIPADLIKHQGTCFYRFHRDALSHGDAMQVIDGFIDGLIANPAASVQAPSLPSYVPLVRELERLRVGTEKYSILEYIAKLAKLGYAVTGHEINVAYGMTSVTSSALMDNFMNKNLVTQQLRAQLVKFPVSTRAKTTGEGLFWTLSSIDGVPITRAQFDSMVAQHNALRQACLDLAQKLDVITRLGQILGDLEWAVNHPKAGRRDTIKSMTLKLQAAFAQEMFDYLMTVRPEWLKPNPTWHP